MARANPPKESARRRNAAFIHELMIQHKLSYQETATLCRVSIHTLRSWMKPPTSVASAKAPDMAVDLLCLKLGVALPGWLK